MAAKKLSSFEFFEKVLRSPRNIVAPMVDQSELAWRLLSKRHGADLCYTPMYHAGVFVRVASYRAKFQTCPEDRPLIVQFCANDPATLLEAAQHVEDRCDAVDINFGCPQGIARKGHYGAFLQEDWDLTSRLIKALHENLKVPVTCKIRILPDAEKTIAYAKMIQDSGCQLLAVHGRTRKMKGPLVGLADWEIIKRIKEALSIPVVANGNIMYYEDIAECIRTTGVDGVMAAEGNLANPAIFEPVVHPVCDLAAEYLQLAKEHDAAWTAVRAHMFRMLHPILKEHFDLRDQLQACKHLGAYVECLKTIKARIDEEAPGAQPVPVSLAPDSGYECGKVKALPIWMSQPNAHDFEADRQLVLTGQRPSTKRPHDPAVLEARKLRKLRKREAREKRLRGENRRPFVFCIECKVQPARTNKGRRLACEYKLCKTCCLKHCEREQVPCIGHKLHRFAPKDGQAGQPVPPASTNQEGAAATQTEAGTVPCKFDPSSATAAMDTLEGQDAGVAGAGVAHR